MRRHYKPEKEVRKKQDAILNILGDKYSPKTVSEINIELGTDYEPQELHKLLYTSRKKSLVKMIRPTSPAYFAIKNGFKGNSFKLAYQFAIENGYKPESNKEVAYYLEN